MSGVAGARALLAAVLAAVLPSPAPPLAPAATTAPASSAMPAAPGPTGSPTPGAAPDAQALVAAMRRAYAAVQDYDCRFTKEERLPEGLLPKEEIRLAFKKPFAVSMRWIGKVHRGRRAIYVEGRNKGKIHAREGGFLGLVAVDLDPNGRRAMTGNRHPITEIGIGHAIDVIGGSYERGRARGELKLRPVTAEELAGRPAWVLEGMLSGAGYAAPHFKLWVDAERSLPVRVEVRDLDGNLLERYEYLELRLNPGVPDDEFGA